MRFDIFGRYRIDVRRIDGRWKVQRPGNGVVGDVDDIVIPDDIDEQDVEQYLNDLLHEEATPGTEIRRV
ncbi:DUF7661 family protein [Paraburkholderia flava]|uniref:DUF7661 family protein n=1 Tax=Paraburkholderia flava TaxID=2547393 RepID=UPI00105BA883|nr:hypothetical protein [Paraburkholderia flava]